MVIQINEQLVIAESQIYSIREVYIWRDYHSNEINARITFDKLNEKGERINSEILTYTGLDFNVFWNNFNSGTFLYEELKSKLGLQLNVPDSEQDFVNINKIEDC
jgi:hypothetical protein